MVARHVGLAYAIADRFFLPGAERDDLRQEALIALLAAARAYDGRVPFAAWARFVVRRKVLEAVRMANTAKQGVLNHSGRDVTLVVAPDAFEALEARTELRTLVRALPRLTALERRALAELLNGVPQDTQTDNAMSRVRRKLRAA